MTLLECLAFELCASLHLFFPPFEQDPRPPPAVMEVFLATLVLDRMVESVLSGLGGLKEILQRVCCYLALPVHF